MRHQSSIIKSLLVGAGLVGAVLAPSTMGAYTTYSKWAGSPTFFINPANGDNIATATLEVAVLTGLHIWNTESGSAFEGNYGGRVSDTSTSNDGRNVVIFRNASNGSAIATTYSWWNASNTLIDSDIVFWDYGRTFFTGTSGCSSGAYVEDIATHEFGHAIGLNHSTDTGATMYPSYGTCSQTQRSLAQDDIDGARALYPAANVSNTAPTVTISNPAGGASVALGTTLTFTGSASDTQQGNLSSSLVWTSSLEGQIGTGASFTRALSTVGTHTITARVTDAGGLQGSRSITVTVTSSNTGGRNLNGRGYKVKSLQKTELLWSGMASTSVDIYRNNVKVMTAGNDGHEVDHINVKGAGTYTYKACEATTTTCSNQVTVVF